MKLIEPSVCIKEQEKGLEGILKQIEWAGRHCYISMDKTTEDSAKKFVDRLIKNKHLAMLEHGTVYLDLPNSARNFDAVPIYALNKYSRLIVFRGKDKNHNYVTTNYRVLVENGWLDDLQYLCEPTEYHKKRYTLKFTTSIGITRELIRHRHLSFANESTRYCNYSRDKFDNEITFVMPEWYIEHKYSSFKLNEFDRYLEKVEDLYMFYMDCELQPQEAREVLPLCTKSELVMTGFESDWKDFFDKRLKGTTGKPHPDMIHLCELAQEELTKNGIVL